MHPFQTTSRAHGSHPRSHSGASCHGTYPQPLRDHLSPPPPAFAISPSLALKRVGGLKIQNDPSPIFEHSAPPLFSANACTLGPAPVSSNQFLRRKPHITNEESLRLSTAPNRSSSRHSRDFELPNDPSPIFGHFTPHLPSTPNSKTKSPLPLRTQPLPFNPSPSKAPTPLRVSSESPRLRVESTVGTFRTLPPKLTPRFSTDTKSPLPLRTQPLPFNSSPSKTPAPLRVSSESPRLRVEDPLPSKLTPRFSTQYSQKLIRHILDFPVTAAPPSARRTRA